MKKRKKIIFFDFDGVIADTFDVNFGITKQMDPGVKTKDDFRNLFNGNINDWKKGSSLDEAGIKKIDDEFFARYVPKMAAIRVFPGMREAVKELAKSYTLVIISSSIASAIKDFLERNDMIHCFEKFAVDNIVHNGKTDRIKKAFKKNRVEPKDCVFVTDTLGDMLEAANCGITSIGVSWGFQKKKSLLKANPFKIAEDSKELVSAISEYFKTV